MQNDNERRGLPADIDLLITAAQQVAYGYENGCNSLAERIEHLSKVCDRVEPQYRRIFDSLDITKGK